VVADKDSPLLAERNLLFDKQAHIGLSQAGMCEKPIASPDPDWRAR
jgi:hypothetical protein